MFRYETGPPPTYVITTQVPSNVFLKRLRPSIWLSLLMLLWGIMMVSELPFNRKLTMY